MEDKEVKDKTVPDKAPEKNLKKPSGKSATGKPLDGIDINPQLNDVNTDGNQLKIRKEDSVDLTVPVIQERKALTLPQRQKRGRTLRAREPRMVRAREVAKTKLAPASKIEQRALAHARALVKSRFSARKGVTYAELSTTEKIQVDNAVAKKTNLIKKIAARLLPRIRKAEYERLKSFRNGEKLQDLSTQNPKSQGIMPKVTEEMSQLFNTLDNTDTNSLIGIIEDTIKQFNNENNPLGDQLKKMLNAVLPEDVVTESLLKKSQKTNISFSTLKEVFERGEYSWDASNRMTQEQFAFARVNSYIAKGKAWHMDADVREEKTVNAKLDEAFTLFLEAMDKNHPIVKEYNALKKHDIKTLRSMISQSGGVVDTSGFKSKDHAVSHIIRSKHGNKKVDRAFGFAEETQATKIRKKIEVVDRPPASQAVKTRQQEIQKKIIDESGNTPYVKSFSQNDSGEHSGWKASNKHGKVKYFGKDFKVSAMKHAGVTEDTDLDEGIKEKIRGAIRREKSKDLPLVQTRRDYAMNKAGDAYNKGNTRKGNQYSAWAERDRKKMGHSTTNPAGTYRTKTNDYRKEDTATDREIGTNSLVKKYKKETPGQKSSLDESFNMAWTSGIGVTLSAADCGIQMKGGFELHPDVIEQMGAIEEDVVAADKKPVYMPPRRHKDGSFGKASTAMRRTGKKIIDVKEPDDVDSDEHDGK